MSFSAVVLLTGREESAALAALLRGHNPALTVHEVRTLEQLEALPAKVAAHARLISFVNGVVVPRRILETYRYGAYNFHPGPPHYPGWAPAHFAVYDRATEFGATAHVMHERVDSGPIVGVDLFPITTGAIVTSLEEMAFVRLARLFWTLAKPLATQPEPLPEIPIRWCGRRGTRRSLATMCDLPHDISGEEMKRRIEIFGAGHFGTELTVTLHGHRFRYVGPETTAVGDEPARQATA
jgi:hypothetical protein